MVSPAARQIHAAPTLLHWYLESRRMTAPRQTFVQRRQACRTREGSGVALQGQMYDVGTLLA